MLEAKNDHMQATSKKDINTNHAGILLDISLWAVTPGHKVPFSMDASVSVYQGMNIYFLNLKDASVASLWFLFVCTFNYYPFNYVCWQYYLSAITFPW